MKIDKYFIVSFVLNILTFLFVVVGTIITATVKSDVLGDNTLSVFRFFTFQSNLFMGIVSAIYAYYQILILAKKKDKIPHVLNIFNLVGVSAVGLTFIIVIGFLAPGYGFDKMYVNANFFYHGLVPVIALVNYMFFTRNEKYHFLQTLFTILPSLLYGIVYFIVVDSHDAYYGNNPDYDFYMFGKDGPYIGILYFVAVMSIAYAIAVGIYFVNRLVFKKR